MINPHAPGRLKRLITLLARRHTSGSFTPNEYMTGTFTNPFDEGKRGTCLPK
jgi:hypothetical protein